MMIHVRRIASTRHPLVLGGGVSGALVAAAVAAFVSITALVSSNDLPGGIPTLSPVRSGTVTLPAGPHGKGRQPDAGAPTERQGPLALSVPTASGVASTTSPTTPTISAATPLPVVVATAARTAVRFVADAAGRPDRSAHRNPRPAHHGDGASQQAPQTPGAVQTKVSAATSSTSSGSVTTAEAAPETGVAKTSSSGGTTAPSPAPAPPSSPPGLQSKPEGLPPGLAKKPGGIAPGLAKKPGGIPPGQAKH